MTKIHLFGFLLLLLTGCNDLATFDKPQPPDRKAIPAFPSSILGHYINNHEPSSLTITSNMVTTSYEITNKIWPGQVDTTGFDLVNDSLVNKSTGEKYKVILSGDTIIKVTFNTDTLFNLSNNDILKNYKGYYFLNKQNPNQYWSVYRLSLSKGQLILGTIRDSMDIKQLKEISENIEDSTGYHFKPTEKQFEKFIKQNGFRERDTFYKVPGH